MNKKELKNMILKGKWGKTIHLNQDHGLDKLRGPDVVVLAQLLRNEYAGTRDLALEDLNVSDSEAVVLAELTEVLPLTDFALQGSRLGDNCAISIVNGLANRAAGIEHVNGLTWPKSLSCEQTEATGCRPNKLLQTCLLGAPEATDKCLPVLADLFATHPSLVRFNMRWSDKFTELAAWSMAASILERNISLREIGCYGFIQDKNRMAPPWVYFVNEFMSMTVKRNSELAKTPKSESYKIYSQSIEEFNDHFSKEFLKMQKGYGLENFYAYRYFCKPLVKEKFDALFEIELYKKQQFTQSTHVQSEPEQKTGLSIVPKCFLNKYTCPLGQTDEVEVIEDYYSLENKPEATDLIMMTPRVDQVMLVEPKEACSDPSNWQMAECQMQKDDGLVIKISGSPVKSLKLAIAASGRMINLVLDLKNDGFLKASLPDANHHALR